MFRVGQKVVCIKRGAWSHVYGWEKTPVFGEIYTVRAFDPDGLLLYEIVNPSAPHIEGFAEAHWCETRFRPLVHRKTSIEIFTKMLTPHGVDA